MDILSRLSHEQKKAGAELSARVCILAGAGSGKTRVITHRMAYLIKELHIPPYQVMGITFTNKAAKEMRQRMENLLGNEAISVNLSTFHGMAAKFLRYYGEFISVPKDFLIYDEDDAVRLIKKLIRERYDLAKDEMQTLIHKVMYMRELAGSSHEEEKYLKSSGQVRELLDAYKKGMHAACALDFSLLLHKFLELLRHEEARNLIFQKCRHLVVDEYQDINAIQADIVDILAENAKSTAIVGDDDQSIYSWRGGSSKFMQQFIKKYPDAKLFRLEENYRSPVPILDAANAVIKNNQGRLGKTLRSMIGDGQKVSLKRYFRESYESLAVVDQCIREFEQQEKDHEIAILLRTNAQSRPFEEALHRARLPYRVIGGMRFYDRKEIRDALAGLKCVLYENSDMDLLRVLNALPFGIGEKTQSIFAKYASSLGISMFCAMEDDRHRIKALEGKRGSQKILEFCRLINRLREKMIYKKPDGEKVILPADEAIILVIEEFGFAKFIQEKNDEAESRIENLEQLVQAASSFVSEALIIDTKKDAQAFLETVTLMSKDEIVEDKIKNETGKINLMTLHAAKGLEFDCVFIVGLEEGILPHSRSISSVHEDKRLESLEEERRLLYVGMTRAKRKLFLSYCQERFMHGKTLPSIRSRFLDEIPKECIEFADRWLLSQNRHYLKGGIGRYGISC